MAGIDPKYIPINTLQQYFVDLATGFPLAAGIVTFYQDSARTTLKPVFQLQGTFPDYTYVQLDNPLILSSSGTFVDGDGNDIAVYLYPYNADGTVDRYYITVTSADTTAEFVREAVPSLESGSSGDVVLTNYIPNGQFLLHNNIPNSGVVSQDITAVAPGGWTYERTNDSLDVITFRAINGYSEAPATSPAYVMRIATAATAATYKNLCITFTDVNKFTTPDSVNKTYKLAFSAKAIGSNVPLTITAYKYFGAGGAAPVSIPIFSPTIVTSGFAFYQNSVDFGNNTGLNNGAGNYVKIIIGLPVSGANQIELTDFVLAPDNPIITEFPTTTDSEFCYQSLPAPIPDPDGFDEYCYLMKTSSGLVYDHSTICSIQLRFDDTVPAGWLPFDDTTYVTTDYNATTHIPYARLQALLWRTATKLPLFGTGQNYVTSQVSADATKIFIATNKAATGVSAITAGTSGFTINACCNAAALYPFTAYMSPSVAYGYLHIQNHTAGVLASHAGSSGTHIVTGTFIYGDEYASTDYVYEISSIQVVSIPAAGDYIQLWSDSNISNHYNFWFKVDDVGTAPSVGGTNVEVDIRTTAGIAGVYQALIAAINSRAASYITLPAASSITGGMYFEVYGANNDHYKPYYRVNGAGTAPTSNTPIAIDILSGDTAAQVATKTLTALNMYSFTLPKSVNGLFLRATNKNSGNDPDSAWRIAAEGGIPASGDEVGSTQLDAVLANLIKYSDATKIEPPVSGQNPYNDSTTTVPPETPIGNYISARNNGYASYPGWKETRPRNISVNLLIKY
jgi:hypothetical protein